MKDNPGSQQQRMAVVATALINAQKALGLSNETLGKIIGVEASTVTRIARRGGISDGKTLERAVLLIRAYDPLYLLRGGDLASMRHWVITANLDFNEGPPLKAMEGREGLADVARYLEAMRIHC